MTQLHFDGIVPEWTMGDRLARSLRHADLGVGEMADYLGVSRNTVGNYINDRRSIPRPTLMLWAMRTGVPIEWLLSGKSSDGSPEPPLPGRRDDAAMAALVEQKRSRSRGARTTRQYSRPLLVGASAA